ncbi:hypothetical protein, partial [Carnobacterium alterfunditum]|uniref:hypothetical protein n=1 Tax=Carnobacterium alterfunditum TaxID=28230 RepID=UPI0035946A67
MRTFFRPQALPWLSTSKSVIPEEILFETPTPFFLIINIYRTKKESFHQFPDKKIRFLILGW